MHNVNLELTWDSGLLHYFLTHGRWFFSKGHSRPPLPHPPYNSGWGAGQGKGKWGCGQQGGAVLGGGPQLCSQMTSPGPARPALLSTWSADVNQHSGLLTSCPGPGPTPHSGSPENAESLPRDQCLRQEEQLLENSRNCLPGAWLGTCLHFLILGPDPRLTPSWPCLYLPAAVWNEGLLALSSSMVVSWGPEQNQAPPGKLLPRNWDRGGNGAGTSPFRSLGAESTVAFPTLEAHPGACVKDLLQTHLEKLRRKIPKALARGSAP